ncbi:MAG: AAA family ATPase [Bacteroidaceae bacterium]|nr:AAA family ATPase [Bacteroidaceae bacterium]
MTAFEMVQQSVAQHALTDEERALERLRITRERTLPPMDFLLHIYDKPCLPRGELVAITGKAKSGKTLFASMILACCGRAAPTGIPYLERARTAPLRCLWYDTEQSEQSTQDILRHRLLPMAGVGEPGADGATPAAPFDVFNVRCLHYEERLRLFEAAVERYRPDLVLLDGVRDLMADINDGVRAQEVVERLMRLAQEAACCLVCVLHQNKGAEDRNLRGWLGTEITNKAFEVYACEKTKPENIFVVEQTYTRKYDLNHLLCFRMDEATELPVGCAAPLRYASLNAFGAAQQPVPGPDGRLPHMNRQWLTFDEQNKPHPKTAELFYEALKAGPLHYSALQNRVQTLLNCGSQMWNSMFREMRDSGGIVRTTNAQGKAVWLLPTVTPASPTPAPPPPADPDLFEAIAAELGADMGVSPSSWPPLRGALEGG